MCYKLSEKLRARLKRPLGHLIPKERVERDEVEHRIKGATLVVSVGDVTTKTLILMGISPDVQVVDGKVMRVEGDMPPSNHKVELKVKNPAGCISKDALNTILKALKLEKPVRIIVEGEEDLLTLPVVAFYPPSTKVLYGQPEEGLVVVDVDSKRSSALRILKKMGFVHKDG